MALTLKAARVNAGMTQIQAAKKLGVSNQTLGRWEKDPKQVTLEMILKMCELYRIDLESLFLK